MYVSEVEVECYSKILTHILLKYFVQDILAWSLDSVHGGRGPGLNAMVGEGGACAPGLPVPTPSHAAVHLTMRCQIKLQE